MRILLVSDTHHDLNNLKILAATLHGVDMVFHLGDSEGQEQMIRELFDCPVLIVRGNCDWFSQENEEIVTEIAGTTFFLTHGHRFRDLFTEARRRGAKIVCCGHSHKPLVLEQEGILLVNPGSLSYPRQESRLPSYAVLNQTASGEFYANYVEIDE